MKGADWVISGFRRGTVDYITCRNLLIYHEDFVVPAHKSSDFKKKLGSLCCKLVLWVSLTKKYYRGTILLIHE